MRIPGTESLAKQRSLNMRSDAKKCWNKLKSKGMVNYLYKKYGVLLHSFLFRKVDLMYEYTKHSLIDTKQQ